MFDPMEFLQQSINFLILAFLLHRLLYKPVRKFMDERTASIENQIRAAEEQKESAEKLRRDLEAQLAEQNRQAKQYLDQAIQRGEAMQEEIMAKAKVEAEQLKDRALVDINREKEKAWSELKDSVVQLSFDLASKVIKGSLDQQTHERLIKDAVAGLDDLSVGEKI